MVRTSVTLLQNQLITLEAKNSLTSSDLSVECLLKKIEALDAELNEHRFAVIDLVGDDEQN